MKRTYYVAIATIHVIRHLIVEVCYHFLGRHVVNMWTFFGPHLVDYHGCIFISLVLDILA